MFKKIKSYSVWLIASFLFIGLVSCDPELTDLSLQSSEDSVDVSGVVDTSGAVDDNPVDPIDPDDVITEPADPTFAAVIINGDLEYFRTVYAVENPTYSHDQNDENDIWDPNSNSTLKDGSTAPFGNTNSDLKSSAGVQSAGMSSGSNSGDEALKFSDGLRVAYQAFTVEPGVTYTIKFWLDGENDLSKDFTVYMLNNEVADESDLEGNSDAVYVATPTNDYGEHSFTFMATTSTAVFYAKPDATTDGDSEVWLDDISVETPGFTSGGGGGGGTTATFAAVILNGDIETYKFKDGTSGDGDETSTPAGVDNDQDNADAFSFTPSSTVIANDGAEITSPYTWSNDPLKQAVLAGSGCSDTSTTGGVTSSEYDGNWGIKMNETNRRLYQEFAVEVGVTYTITLYVKMESTNFVDFYILNNAVADESDLSGNSDGSLKVTGDGTNTDYTEYTFDFTATSTTAVFYAVPDFASQAVTKNECEFGDAEIFVDNISIATPGF